MEVIRKFRSFVTKDMIGKQHLTKEQNHQEVDAHTALEERVLI